jgi:DNA-binding SARP family transcriptional activator
VEFRILGPLEVRKDRKALALGGRKQRALLAALLLRANRVVPTETLVDELWGDAPPETAGTSVYVYVSQLRKALGEEGRLVTRKPGYELRVEPEELDLASFEKLVREGRDALARDDPEPAARKLRQGLELWRGAPLADLGDQSFALRESARLEELRLAALEDRIAADLALGRHARLVGELEGLVAEHPFREGLRGHLILALYRSGRQAEALDAYHKARQLLIDELGIDPSPALQELERRILRQDPALELPVPVAVPEDAPRPHRPRELRKTVTILHAGVATSSASGEELDPELLSSMMERFRPAFTEAIGRHGGTPQRATGQEATAVFGSPTVHEDDALRAVRAALDLRTSLTELGTEFEQQSGVSVAVGIGISTGDVLAVEADEREPVVEGEALSTASRLEEAAGGGEILIGERSWRVLRDAIRSEPVAPLVSKRQGGVLPAWRVIEALEGAAANARRLEAPLVGRETELNQLRLALERALRDRGCGLVTVLGPAGIGKSRLAAEFQAGVEHEATVLTGRCLSYGDGITFWPLAEVVGQAVGDDLRLISQIAGDGQDGHLVTESIASAIGRGDSTVSREEAFFAFRRLFEGLARTRPLVLILDDVHWGEPTFLDLIEHIVDFSRDASILLVCLARTELLDARPDWGGRRTNAATFVLEPLSAGECERLIDNFLEHDPLEAETRLRVVQTAEGNPLFVEQMLSLLVRDGEEQTLDRLPPTIHALIAARLEALDPPEQELITSAAVIGKVFSPAAVEALTDGEAAQMTERLVSLLRKDLICPDPSRFAGEDAFRFRHGLIRDVAYSLLPKSRRAELHRRFGEWLEHSPRHLAEYEEILGYHFEQAYRYVLEQRAPDSRDRELGTRGHELLVASGRRAYAQGDMTAAVNLLTRAASIAPDEQDAKGNARLDLGEALREVGDFTNAGAALDEAHGLGAGSGNQVLQAHARVSRMRIAVQLSEATPDDLVAEAEAAIPVFEAAGDDSGLAKAWMVLAWSAWMRCHAGVTADAAERSADHARAAGDSRTEAHALGRLAGCDWTGPTPVAEAVERWERILARPPSQQRIVATAYRVLASLRAMQGAFAEARELIERDRQIARNLGLRVTLGAAAELYGFVEMLAGNVPAAEQEFREGYDILTQMGERSGAPTIAALLAETVRIQGRPREALELIEAGERTAADDDIYTKVHSLGTRAHLLAAEGRFDEAASRAEAGVEIAATTDFLNTRGNTLMVLAEVLLHGARGEEAADAARRAVRLYEAKGNVVSARAATAFLDGLAERFSITGASR